MAQQGDQLAHGEPHGEPHGDLEKECGPLEVALGSGIERLQAAASRDEQQTDASNKDTAASLRILATRMANLCLLYTSPSPRDATLSRMPSSA